jgi:cadmium resistance protein CadD (predicted permease)
MSQKGPRVRIAEATPLGRICNALTRGRAVNDMLKSAISLVVVSARIFASTNIDDLFVLGAFFGDRSVPRWCIVAGQILGIATILGMSVALAYAALSISPARVGLIGVAPVLLGIVKLLSCAEPRRRMNPKAVEYWRS